MDCHFDREMMVFGSDYSGDGVSIIVTVGGTGRGEWVGIVCWTIASRESIFFLSAESSSFKPSMSSFNKPIYCILLLMNGKTFYQLFEFACA